MAPPAAGRGKRRKTGPKLPGQICREIGFDPSEIQGQMSAARQGARGRGRGRGTPHSQASGVTASKKHEGNGKNEMKSSGNTLADAVAREEAYQRRLNKLMNGRLGSSNDGLLGLADGLPDGTMGEDELQRGVKRKEEEVMGRLDEGAYASQGVLEEEQEEEGMDDASLAKREVAGGKGSEGKGASYVPPHKRRKGGNTAEAKKRAKSCVNKLGSGNVEAMLAELAKAMEAHGHQTLLQAYIDEVASAISAGPRGGQHFLAALACTCVGVGAILGSKSLASILRRVGHVLETARASSDAATSYNAVCLLGLAYVMGACGPSVVWGLADRMAESLGEADVSQLLLLLRLCGWKLRSEDAAGFKRFLERLSDRCARLKEQGELPKRARLLLDLVVELKNNTGKVLAGQPLPEPTSEHWKALRAVNAHQVGWALADADYDSVLEGRAGAGREHAEGHGSKRAVGEGNEEEEELERKAGEQRLGTGSRKRVFRAIMGSEDYLHAAERFIKLGMGASAEKEAIRAIIELCAQERSYNRFYELLLSHLARHHRPKQTAKTIQFAMWDTWRDFSSSHSGGHGDGQESAASNRRASHLGTLFGSLLAEGALPITSLRAASLAEPDLPEPAPRHFSALVKALLSRSGSPQKCHSLLSKLVGKKGRVDSLRRDLAAFFQARVLNDPSLQSRLLPFARAASSALQGLPCP